jgi:hypothetical protein
VLADGAREQPEDVLFALGVVRFERDDVPRSVVEDGVDPERLPLAVDEQARTVTYVGVPKRVWPLGLPSQPHAWTTPIAQRDPVEALLLEEPADRRLRDRALVERAIDLESPHDQRRRCVWVLAPDLAQELPLLLRAAGTGLGLRGVWA